MRREAIEYFKFHRKIFCEDHLKICPKDSIAYQATLKEKEFYDMAISALEHPERNVVAIVPCGDTISRQAVIDLMMQKWGENFSGDDAMQESIDAIRALPSVTPQEPRWISVSERLPEKAFGCIVTVEVDNILTGEPVPTVLTYVVGYDGETWNNADGIPIPYEVIAWMPLPKPYREVEE